VTDRATVAPRVLRCGCTVLEEDRPHYDPRLRKNGFRSTTVLRVQIASPHCPEMGCHGPSRRD
jgi:hypothetical protein